MVISWGIFCFRFSAVLGKKTNVTPQIELSASELCSKYAWGDICEKVSGKKSWNINLVRPQEIWERDYAKLRKSKNSIIGNQNQPPKLKNSNCNNSELNTAIV